MRKRAQKGKLNKNPGKQKNILLDIGLFNLTNAYSESAQQTVFYMYYTYM